ncbi:DUF397 domain-containing protein [Streptomyces actinomycinicus]|uniref:DUF397 domain-containing protein n=2 Tax=Streptomyces actinomycinicus TaxID=1695166 RepID=A0A937ELE7_9ACTN|nr:DUF397 domain-containing protein [Streptomyces actinomycinicus]
MNGARSPGTSGEQEGLRWGMCGNENECLEVAVREDLVFARDSKHPRSAPLSFTAVAWTEFLRAVTRVDPHGL